MSLRIVSGPMPIERPLGQPDDIPDREWYCTHYDAKDGCLDTAIEKNWPSWDCSACPIRGTCNLDPREADRWMHTLAPPPKDPVVPKRDENSGRFTANGMSDRVWACFTQRETWTARDLAARLGCKTFQVYDAVRVLERKDRVQQIGRGLYSRVAS